MILYIADFLSRKQRVIDNFFRGLMPPIVVLGATCLLILLQPDLGTVFAISAIVFLLLFVGGADVKHMGIILAVSLVMFGILIFSAPYRRARILAFLNPWGDPQGTGFQMVQAQIALGSGGLLGEGLGLGKGKLFYLPAAHTDFIFSIIGEELGLLGTISIVWLYIVFFIQGLRVMHFCKDDFGRYTVIGLVCLLTMKVFVNIAVNLGLLPTKGLPLPFVSYGGTSLIADMVAVALILNVSRFSEEL
jgi:cell division protein FtsW